MRDRSRSGRTSAGAALAPSGFVSAQHPPNTLPACSHQHTVADIVQAVLDAGLALQTLREWPYVNGCRVHAGLVDVGNGRFAAPPPWSLPLMVGLRATKPPGR